MPYHHPTGANSTGKTHCSAGARSDQRTDKALDRAMRLLTVRARSRYELSKRLRAAGFEEATVRTVDHRLVDVGLLDDEAFADNCAKRAAAAGKSAGWIRRDLAERGVPAAVIDRTLSELGLEGLEYDRALAIARRRAAVSRELSPSKSYQRLTRYLCRRGFEHDLAAEVVRTVLEGSLTVE